MSFVYRVPSCAPRCVRIARLNNHRKASAAAAPASPPTARELLDDAGLASILAEHGAGSASDPLPSTASRVAVVAHFAACTRRPMPSDAFAAMRSAADAAAWYELALRPAMPDPHARRLMAHAREADIDAIEGILAASGGEVDPALMSDALPANLALDPTTFVVRPRKKLVTAKRPKVYARGNMSFKK
jgi:hypothetical protein